MSGRLTWSDVLSVNVKDMDHQHMRLLGLLNELSEALSQQKGEVLLDTIFKDLLDYVALHFADEEALLRRIAYPELEKQVSEHKEFVLTVRKWLDSPSLIDPQQVLMAIEQWLVVHISRSDAAYIPYVLLDKTRVKKS